MRNPDGVVYVSGDLRRTDVGFVDLATGVSHVEREVDTFVCGHCQHIVHVLPGQAARDVGGGCRVCDRNICPACVNRGICTPFEEMLARQESRRSILSCF